MNKAVGGAATSNHLTGCAADIRCEGIEQAIRYACILLDISDESQEDFDELLIEQSARSVWVHFAVRPEGNRCKVALQPEASPPNPLSNGRGGSLRQRGTGGADYHQ